MNFRTDPVTVTSAIRDAIRRLRRALTFPRDRPRWCTFAVFAIVFGAVSIGITGVPLRAADDAIYVGLAASLTSGHGLVLPASIPVRAFHYPPGYPLLLAPAYAISHSPLVTSLWAAWLNALFMGLGAALWTRIFARRIGGVPGALAVIWPIVTTETLWIVSAPMSEASTFFLVACLARWLDARASWARSNGPRLREWVALSAILGTILLVRTQFFVLFPLVAWELRRVPRKKWLAGSLLAAATFAALITLAFRSDAPNVSYTKLVELSWQGGTHSEGARIWWNNVSVRVWATLADEYLTTDRMRMNDSVRVFAGAALSAFFATVYVRRWRTVDPPPLLWSVPVVLAPFFFGYPFHISSRFLIPVSPILGWLGYTSLATLLQNRQGVLQGVLGAWVALQFALWVHRAPIAGNEREALREIPKMAAALRGRFGPLDEMCSNFPEALWLGSPNLQMCRTEGPELQVLSTSERNAAVAHELEHLPARCIVIWPRMAVTTADVYTASSYELAYAGEHFHAWCRHPQAR